jgi:copper chaperone
MEKTTLQVKGMTCGHCEKAVRTALEGVEGVRKATVHLQEGTVDVEFDSAKVSVDKMKETIEDQGYDVV